MVAADPLPLLRQSLKPADLRLGGAGLYRRLLRALGDEARVGDDPFVRLPGATPVIVVQIKKGGNEIGSLCVLAESRGRVQAIAVPATGGWGVRFGEWRRRGDRVVGTFYDRIGNRDAVGVAVFACDACGWRLTGSREADGEADSIVFTGAGLDRLRVSTPSDDFRRFDGPPHAGPHLTLDTPWAIHGSRIVVGQPRLRRNALFAFDRFAEAVDGGDRRQAARYCDPSVFWRAWRSVRSMRGVPVGVTCPDGVQEGLGRVFGLFDHRHRSDPTVYFEWAYRQGHWRVVSLRRHSALTR